MSIELVNHLDDEQFVTRFGSVYEASPQLAVRAGLGRPYADREELVGAFDQVAATLYDDEVLELLRAHPVLGARGPMAAASVAEQTGAGLRDLEPERQERIERDNAAYQERFGFPFILAVQGASITDIEAAMARRLAHPYEVELDEALQQVRRIAALRIERLVTP